MVDMKTSSRTTVAIAAAALIGGVAAGCSSTTTSQSEAPGPQGTSSPTGVIQAPAADNTGPLGSTFTLNPTDLNGKPSGAFQIKLDQIRYGVTTDSTEYGVPPKAGDTYVGLHFWAKAIDAGACPDPMPYVTILGSNGEGYSVNVTVNDQYLKPMGNSGLAWAGQHEDGWVAAEMPKGVTVVSVKYQGIAVTPDMQPTGGADATWNVR